MQALVRIDALPAGAIEAAQLFYSEWVPQVVEALESADAAALVLPPAPHDHDDWRRAAARDLARAHAPKRINIVAGEDAAALTATVKYLGGTPGVTGHYLKVDGNGAGNPAQ